MKTISNLFLICALSLTATITYADRFDEHEDHELRHDKISQESPRFNGINRPPEKMETPSEDIEVYKLDQLTPDMGYWSFSAPEMYVLDWKEFMKLDVWEHLTQVNNNDMVLATVLDWKAFYYVKDFDNGDRMLCRYGRYVQDPAECDTF